MRPTSRSAKVHYLIADGNGNAASIEFIGGKMVWRKGDSMPYTVLTNSTYDESLEYHEQHLSGEGNEKHSSAQDSFTRFSEACYMGENYDRSKGNAVDYSFGILSKVSQGDFTKWSIVYDVKNLAVHFRTDINNAVRTLKLGDVDFECGGEELVIDLNENVSGDIKGSLKLFTISINEEMIRKAYSEVSFLKDVSDADIISTAEIPDGFECEKQGYLKNQIVSINDDKGNSTLYLVIAIGLVALVITSLFAGKLKENP